MTEEELQAIEARAMVDGSGLLPCPFCGGDGITVTSGDPYCDDRRVTHTRCLKCKCTTVGFSWHQDDISGTHAVCKKAWNNQHARQDVPALVAEVRRLREALGFYGSELSYNHNFEYAERGSEVVATDISESDVVVDRGKRARAALGMAAAGKDVV